MSQFICHQIDEQLFEFLNGLSIEQKNQFFDIKYILEQNYNKRNLGQTELVKQSVFLLGEIRGKDFLVGVQKSFLFLHNNNHKNSPHPPPPVEKITFLQIDKESYDAIGLQKGTQQIYYALQYKKGQEIFSFSPSGNYQIFLTPDSIFVLGDEKIVIFEIYSRRTVSITLNPLQPVYSLLNSRLIINPVNPERLLLVRNLALNGLISQHAIIQEINLSGILGGQELLLQKQKQLKLSIWGNPYLIENYEGYISLFAMRNSQINYSTLDKNIILFFVQNSEQKLEIYVINKEKARITNSYNFQSIRFDVRGFRFFLSKSQSLLMLVSKQDKSKEIVLLRDSPNVTSEVLQLKVFFGNEALKKQKIDQVYLDRLYQSVQSMNILKVAQNLKSELSFQLLMHLPDLNTFLKWKSVNQVFIRNLVFGQLLTHFENIFSFIKYCVRFFMKSDPKLCLLLRKFLSFVYFWLEINRNYDRDLWKLQKDYNMERQHKQYDVLNKKQWTDFLFNYYDTPKVLQDIFSQNSQIDDYCIVYVSLAHVNKQLEFIEVVMTQELQITNCHLLPVEGSSAKNDDQLLFLDEQINEESHTRDFRNLQLFLRESNANESNKSQELSDIQSNRESEISTIAETQSHSDIFTSSPQISSRNQQRAKFSN